MDLPELLPPAAWLALHVAGLSAALMSRLHIGAKTDVALQLLAGVGFFAIASHAILSMLAGGDQLRLLVISAGALVMMVLATVIESRSEPIDPMLARFAGLED